jgi:hypothetical protein
MHKSKLINKIINKINFSFIKACGTHKLKKFVGRKMLFVEEPSEKINFRTLRERIKL